MANGDSFNSTGQLVGKYDFKVWDNLQAAGNGTWKDISAVRSASIHVTALSAGDALVIMVSNAPELPADTVDGVIDQTITGDGTQKFVMLSKLPARYFKVNKTGSTAVATAYLHGLSR